VANVASLHESEPRGIVIKSGTSAPKPVRCWAYVWAADEDASGA
jgi:hypothetical protein